MNIQLNLGSKWLFILLFRLKNMMHWRTKVSEKLVKSWKLLDTVIEDVVDKYNNCQESESIKTELLPGLTDPLIQGDV